MEKRDLVNVLLLLASASLAGTLLYLYLVKVVASIAPHCVCTP